MQFIALLGLSIAAVVHAQAPSNPFCGYLQQRNTIEFSLVCVAGVIDNVTSAFFGTPTGCPSPVAGSCDDSTFLAYAQATCVGQQNCTLQSQGDPCGGVVKAIAAVAHCSLPPGGYAVYPLPPACFENSSPCPPPHGWAPEWSLTYSSTCEPSSSDMFLPPPDEPWGLVDLDWSVGSSIWDKNGPANGTIEATLVANCQQIKEATGNKSRCAVYHNTELCLEAMESQRAILNDPANAPLFLQYTDGRGNKNGTVYIELGGPGRQAFWDYRANGTTEAVIYSILATVSSPWVDATFLDDLGGLPEEHPNAPANMNLSAAEVQEIRAATAVAVSRIFDAVLAAGKYVMPAFAGAGVVTADSCTAAVRGRCNVPDWTDSPSIYGMGPANATNQSLAYFLTTRGPISYVGWGWESDQRQWLSEFMWDVGAPLGNCSETAPNVFSRAWSFGNTTLDCNTFTAEIAVGPA